MKRERTYREQLRGTYHYLLTFIASHLAGPDRKPTQEQIKAVKAWAQAKFYTGLSSEELSDEELSAVINEVEAHAAGSGISFPARREPEPA